MIIRPDHFEYLSVQRGEVAHLKDDFDQWKVAYEASLQAIYDSIKPELPAVCRSILDIGSGLGGINIHLSKRYEPAPFVALLDGLDDKPQMVLPYHTHSNETVAKDFLRVNGVEKVWSISPEKFKETRAEFDLVVSFAAYGFHINPEVYLNELVWRVRPGAVIIFEVRREKPDWLEEFVKVFGRPVNIYRTKKFDRLVWNI